jgi:hypothetical protein
LLTSDGSNQLLRAFHVDIHTRNIMYKLRILELGGHLLALTKGDLQVSTTARDAALVMTLALQRYIARQDSIGTLLALIVLFDQV